MLGHFRSRYKDGGHTIQSTIAENPTLHTNFMAQSRSYCRQKFYIAGIRIFYLSCSCDLDLDPMTFIYEPDSYSLEIYRTCKYELLTSKRLLKVIV